MRASLITFLASVLVPSALAKSKAPDPLKAVLCFAHQVYVHDAPDVTAVLQRSGHFTLLPTSTGADLIIDSHTELGEPSTDIVYYYLSFLDGRSLAFLGSKKEWIGMGSKKHLQKLADQVGSLLPCPERSSDVSAARVAAPPTSAPVFTKDTLLQAHTVYVVDAGTSEGFPIKGGVHPGRWGKLLAEQLPGWGGYTVVTDRSTADNSISNFRFAKGDPK